MLRRKDGHSSGDDEISPRQRLRSAYTPALFDDGALNVHTEAADTARFTRLLVRGAPVIVLCTVLVMLAALLLSRRQPANYQASTAVFVETQAIGSSIANLSGGSEPVRVLSTQSAVARIPAILERAARKLPGTGVTAGYVGAASRVSGSDTADLLFFTVNSPSQALAPRIANAHAQAYVEYRRDADTATLRRAIAETSQQMADLRRSGERDGEAFSALQQRQSQLRQRELLRSTTAAVGTPAAGAAKTSPKPKRDAILGAILGFLLGIGIVLMRNTMNTRVGSAREVEGLVGLPLLGRLVEPPKRLQKDNRLVMLEEPDGSSAEAYRMLSTNVELANLDRGAKSIMVTSATLAEGKSTTIANLAVAFARSGRNVVLADLDLRRPTIHKFFGIEGRRRAHRGDARARRALRRARTSPSATTTRTTAILRGQPAGPPGRVPPARPRRAAAVRRVELGSR